MNRHSQAIHGGITLHLLEGRRPLPHLTAQAGRMSLEMAAGLVGLILLLLTGVLLFLYSGNEPADPIGPTPVKEVQRPVPELVPGIASSEVEREPVASEPPVPLETNRKVEFLAVDQSTRMPLGGVNIFLAMERSRIRLGITNADGILKASLPGSGECIIHSMVDGRMPWSRSFQAPLPDHVLIELAPGHQLRGQVLTQDRQPAGEGVQVVAWASDEFITIESVRRWFDEGGASFPVTITDAKGEFLFDELRPGVFYEILAGSDGQLSTRGWASAGDNGVVLTMRSIYGLLVNIRTEDGALPNMAVPFPGFSLSFPSTLCEDSISWVQPHLLLAGIDIRELLKAPGYDQAYFFVKSSNEPNLGPIKYGLSFPGCQHSASEMYASRVADGLSLYHLELIPLSRSSGSIMFAFEGAARAITSPAGAYTPIASLELADMEQVTFEYEVHDLSSPFRLEGIAHGRYTYRLILNHRMLGDRLWEGIIDHSAETTSISIPVGQFGAIGVSIQDISGSKVHSRATVELISQATSESFRFTYQFPPYRLEGIPAGDYILRLITPKVPSQAVVQSPVFTLPAGEYVEQTLTIPR